MSYCAPDTAHLIGFDQQGNEVPHPDSYVERMTAAGLPLWTTREMREESKSLCGWPTRNQLTYLRACVTKIEAVLKVPGQVDCLTCARASALRDR